MGTVIDISKLPLDNSIQLVPAAGTDPEYYASDNGIVRSEFFEIGNKVVFKRGERSFVWTPNAMKYVDDEGTEDIIYNVQDVPLETKANYARFNRAMPDVDDWFIQDNDRLKHQILLQGFQRDPLPWLTSNVDFVFGGRIEFDADLRVRINGDMVITGAFETGEGIEIIDPDGNVVFDLPQIVAYDSKIPDRAMTYGKYRVNSNAAGVLAFDIVVDNAWISSTERVYPIVIDPTVVVASAYTVSANARPQKLNNGWLVSAVYTGVSPYLRFDVSKDNGATFTNLCFVDYPPNIGWSIASNGNVIYALISNNGGAVNFASFDATTVTVGSNVAWSSIESPTSCGSGASIVVAPNGTLTAAWSSKNATYPNSFNIRSAKSINGGATWNKQDGTAGIDQISTQNTAGVDITNPCIVCTSDNYPHIVASWASTNNYSRAWNWNGSVWTGAAGIAVFVGSTFAQSNPCSLVKQYGSNIGRIWDLWDGLDATDTTKRNVRANWSDDLGITWNTAFKLTTGNTIDRQKPTLAENTNGDVYVFYQDGTGISYQICANGTTTFAAAVTFATAGTNPSAMERAANSIIGVIYMDASQVKFDKLSFNVAPNAPTLTTKANFDATASATFAWTFSDSDIGNTQSAYQIQIIRAVDSVVIFDSGKTVSATASFTLTASTLTNGVNYQWKVKTWDNYDLTGPYSALSTFSTSATPSTIITIPSMDGITLTASSVTANWNYSSPSSLAQLAYQVKLTTSADVVLYDSAKTTDSVARALTIAYTLANSTSYKIKVTTWDSNNIASAEYVRTFVTSFTAPATPTITATAQTSYIAIAISNPVPAGAQPLISSQDVYRRVTGTTSYIRIATGIANNGTYNDYAVASGISYDYYVQANGNNGASANSATASRSITFAGVWLHAVVSPAATVHQFINDGYGRSTNWDAEAEIMEFSGRQKPVVEFGEAAQFKISVSLLLEKNTTDFTSLQSLVYGRYTLCYRDGRGRIVFCTLINFPSDDDFLGYQLNLEFHEIDYTEAV